MSSIFASFSLCTPLEWLCLNINDPLECTPNPSSTILHVFIHEHVLYSTCDKFVADFKLFCLQLHNYNVILASFQTYVQVTSQPKVSYLLSWFFSFHWIRVECFEISVEKHLIWKLPHLEIPVLLYVNS